MSNERERALEAATEKARVAIRDNWQQGCARRCDVEHPGDCMIVCSCQSLAGVVARALLASSPPPSCEMRKALEEIRDHWACNYDHKYANTEAYRGPYGIGIVDGHRAAAAIARAALDASRTEDAWQPIETAPKDGTRIIIAWGGVTTTGRYLDNSKAPHMPWAGWVPVSGDPWPAGKPTHWQPLPAPPSRTEEKS